MYYLEEMFKNVYFIAYIEYGVGFFHLYICITRFLITEY